MKRKSIIQIIRDYTTEAGSLLFLLICGVVSYMIEIIVLATVFISGCILATIMIAIAYSRKNYLGGKK